MKKSKIALVLGLAAVLIAVSVSVPTFSWYTRPRSASGDSLTLNDTETAYNGFGVTFYTTTSPDGVTYPTEATSYSGSNIASNARNYFCTTITNESSVPQNVSLYISKLSIPSTANGTLCMGVNNPTRSYRDFSGLAAPSERTSGTTKRIYFETTNNVEGWTGGDYYVCWGKANLGSQGENGTYYHLEQIGSSAFYFADIPLEANQLFISVKDWGTNNNGEPNWKLRTQTFTDLTGDGLSATQSIDYKITNDEDNGNKKAEQYKVDGANVISFYSTISVAKGGTFNAALTSGTDYIGSSIEYYSGDQSVFTVDKTTGVITGLKEGEAKLYSKVIGSSYSDANQVETVVKVTSGAAYEFTDVPIVTNVQLAPKPTDGSDSADNIVEVYWYVKNSSASANLSYTIDGIYLGV